MIELETLRSTLVILPAVLYVVIVSTVMGAGWWLRRKPDRHNDWRTFAQTVVLSGLGMVMVPFGLTYAIMWPYPGWQSVTVVLPMIVPAWMTFILVEARPCVHQGTAIPHGQFLPRRMISLAAIGLVLLVLGAVYGPTCYWKVQVRSLAGDLRQSDRLEVFMTPGFARATRWYRMRSGDGNDVMSPGASRLAFTIDDPAAIGRLASAIENARFKTTLWWSPAPIRPVGVTLNPKYSSSRRIEVIGPLLSVIGSPGCVVQDFDLQKMICESSTKLQVESAR
jgi:hypothetical protein